MTCHVPSLVRDAPHIPWWVRTLFLRTSGLWSSIPLLVPPSTLRWRSWLEPLWIALILHSVIPQIAPNISLLMMFVENAITLVAYHRRSILQINISQRSSVNFSHVDSNLFCFSPRIQLKAALVMWKPAIWILESSVIPWNVKYFSAWKIHPSGSIPENFGRSNLICALGCFLSRSIRTQPH